MRPSRRSASNERQPLVAQGHRQREPLRDRPSPTSRAAAAMSPRRRSPRSAARRRAPSTPCSRHTRSSAADVVIERRAAVDRDQRPGDRRSRRRRRPARSASTRGRPPGCGSRGAPAGARTCARRVDGGGSEHQPDGTGSPEPGPRRLLERERVGRRRSHLGGSGGGVGVAEGRVGSRVRVDGVVTTSVTRRRSSGRSSRSPARARSRPRRTARGPPRPRPSAARGPSARAPRHRAAGPASPSRRPGT